MLKIHKGLKKKKKDKKNKHKEDDLFNEEELEKYRKEHSNPVPCDDAHSAQSLNSSEQSDEWQTFKALTAGVDTILQKTQEDLDRIKSTSFFQRKAPQSEVEQPKEEHTTEDQLNNKDSKQCSDQKQQQQSNNTVHFHDKSESEDESEELEVDDTLFDTSYVDAATSGELKLAYIPDSPSDKEDDDSLFDTSYVNKVIKSNPKKRYLNLGSAVQVLSGSESSTKPPSVLIEKKLSKNRSKPADLLLTSFEEGVDIKSATVAARNSIERTSIDLPVKTLLDEDSLFVAEENLPIAPLAVTPILPAPPASTPINSVLDGVNEKQIKLDLSDFELQEFENPISTTSADILNLQKQSSNESIEDEFAQLAVQSLARKSSDAELDEFAQLAVESLARKSSSAQPTSNNLTTVQQDFIESTSDEIGQPTKFITVGSRPATPVQPDEIDPFDTSIVTKVILLDKTEIQPSEPEPLSNIAQVHQIVANSADIEENLEYDPFDTSHIC